MREVAAIWTQELAERAALGRLAELGLSVEIVERVVRRAELSLPSAIVVAVNRR
jgi:hypothetical protein